MIAYLELLQKKTERPKLQLGAPDPLADKHAEEDQRLAQLQDQVCTTYQQLTDSLLACLKATERMGID